MKVVAPINAGNQPYVIMRVPSQRTKEKVDTSKKVESREQKRNRTGVLMKLHIKTISEFLNHMSQCTHNYT